MEKRIGAVTILIENKDSIQKLNTLLTDHGSLILGRQGLPLHPKGIHLISLIVEGTTDQIGGFTGKIGRLPGLQVKSVLTKYREVDDDSTANSPQSKE